MRKQFTFVPVTVNNQNELIDALNNDESAIVFTGSEIQEIGKKIKRAHDDKSLFKVLTGVGVLNAVGCIGMLSIPGAIASGVLAIFSGIMTLANKEKISKYNAFVIDEPEGFCVGFIKRSQYNESEDVFSYNGQKIKLTANTRCPKCNKRLDKKFSYGACSHCGTLVSAMTPVDKAKLNKL